MTEAILLSNADFDSGRVAKLARVTEAYLFRFSDEIGVLIRLFVMKFSIANPLNAECGMRNERGFATWQSAIRESAFRIQKFRNPQSMNGRSLSLRFINA
jgi:hypothetical protein